MADNEARRELRRIEYEGFLLIEYESPSAISYGPRTYKSWDISRIESDGSLKFIGHESYEHFARLVADILNGKTTRDPPSRDDLK